MAKTTLTFSPAFGSLLKSTLEGKGYINKGEAGHNWTSLANLAGINPALIGHYVSGRCKPSLPTLQKICRALDVDLAHFVAEPQQATVKAMAKKPAPTSITEGDWRLIEVETNQITRTEIVHHDTAGKLLILKLK